MKIFFTDVDGVLNRADDAFTYTTPAPWMLGANIVDLNKIALYNFTLDELNKHEPVKIVVSSAWRKWHDDAEDFSKSTGIHVHHIHEDWRTPVYGSSADRVRHKEVAEWLKHHRDVKDWIAFDDLNFAFPRKNFVRTKGTNGLTQADLEDALQRWGYEFNYRNDKTRSHHLEPLWTIKKTKTLVPVA